MSEEPVHSGLPPYTASPEPVAVRVTVRGVQRDGQVLGWRGDRVYVRWWTGPGLNHLTWMSAADVERVSRRS